jgi:hypothetical protein
MFVRRHKCCPAAPAGMHQKHASACSLVAVLPRGAVPSVCSCLCVGRKGATGVFAGAGMSLTSRLPCRRAAAHVRRLGHGGDRVGAGPLRAAHARRQVAVGARRSCVCPMLMSRRHLFWQVPHAFCLLLLAVKLEAAADASGLHDRTHLHLVKACQS